jgi:hypothetical protein
MSLSAGENVAQIARIIEGPSSSASSTALDDEAPLGDDEALLEDGDDLEFDNDEKMQDDELD